MPRTAPVVDPKAKDKILARLRSVAGHTNAVIRMVEEDRYCMDVLKQTQGDPERDYAGQCRAA